MLTSKAPAEPAKIANAVFVLIAPQLRANGSPESQLRVVAQRHEPQPALVLLGDPVAFLVLLVLLLYGAPGDTVSTILFSVLLLCGVERLLINLLGVLREVVLHAVRQLRYLLVGHLAPRISWLFYYALSVPPKRLSQPLVRW